MDDKWKGGSLQEEEIVTVKVTPISVLGRLQGTGFSAIVYEKYQPWL